MHRTQLLIEDWQYQALKSRADREGCSISELVRRILTSHLEESPEWAARRLADVQGVAEGPADLGERHDTYLYGRGGKRRR